MIVKICGFYPKLGPIEGPQPYEGGTLYFLEEVPGVVGHASGFCLVSRPFLAKMHFSIGCDAEIEVSDCLYLESFKVL